MATTKVIKDLTEFNPGNPDYVLNATNAVTVINSGGNQYNFNGVYGKFGLRIGTTVLTGVPSGHPIAVLNNGLTGITYTGTVNEGTLAVGGVTYTFYSGDVTITVTADFGVASYYCKIHGYMGGQDNLVSVYSEAGLRMPTGGAFSGTPAEGMMRNDTSQSSLSSASTMQHYTGNNEWKNFVNVTNCTTTNCSYPTTNVALYELNANSNNSSTCATSGSYNGVDNQITYVSGNFGNAASFNGNNLGSNIKLGTANVFTPTNNPITFSCWVKTSSSSTGYLIAKGDDNAVQYEWSIEQLSNGTLTLYAYNNAAGVACSINNTAAINDGNWHNVVGVIVNNTSTTLYIDGTPATSTSWSGTAQNYNLTLYLGAFGSASSVIPAATAHYEGLIDQVRFFTSALNQTQVTQLVNEVGC